MGGGERGKRGRERGEAARLGAKRLDGVDPFCPVVIAAGAAAMRWHEDNEDRPTPSGNPCQGEVSMRTYDGVLSGGPHSFGAANTLFDSALTEYEPRSGACRKREVGLIPHTVPPGYCRLTVACGCTVGSD